MLKKTRKGPRGKCKTFSAVKVRKKLKCSNRRERFHYRPDWDPMVSMYRYWANHVVGLRQRS